MPVWCMAANVARIGWVASRLTRAGAQTLRVGNSATVAANRGTPVAPGETVTFETTAAIAGWNPGAADQSVAVTEETDKASDQQRRETGKTAASKEAKRETDGTGNEAFELDDLQRQLSSGAVRMAAPEGVHDFQLVTFTGGGRLESREVQRIVRGPRQSERRATVSAPALSNLGSHVWDGS